MMRCLIALFAIVLSGCIYTPRVKRGEPEVEVRARLEREFVGRVVSELDLPDGVKRVAYEAKSGDAVNRIVVFYRQGVVDDVEYQTGR